MCHWNCDQKRLNMYAIVGLKYTRIMQLCNDACLEEKSKDIVYIKSFLGVLGNINLKIFSYYT